MLTQATIILVLHGFLLIKTVSVKTRSELLHVPHEDWPIEGPWIVHVNSDAYQYLMQRPRHNNVVTTTTKGKNRLSEYIYNNSTSDEERIVIEGIRIPDLISVDGVDSVYPNRVIQAFASPESWGLMRISQQERINENQQNILDYYPEYCGEGVDVYVLDTGIDTGHSEFEDISMANINFHRDDEYLYVIDPTENTDANGHGTHIAGMKVEATIETYNE